MLLPVVTIRKLGGVRGKSHCDFRIAMEPQNLISELGFVSRFKVPNHRIIEMRFDRVEARDNHGYSQSIVFEQFRRQYIVSKSVCRIRDDSDCRFKKYCRKLLYRHSRHELNA